MTSLKKEIDKFLKNPGTLRYNKIEKVLLHLGFIKIPAKGSHVKFKHPKMEKDLVIPVHKNDCKLFYKEKAAGLIKDHKLYN